VSLPKKIVPGSSGVVGNIQSPKKVVKKISKPKQGVSGVAGKSLPRMGGKVGGKGVAGKTPPMGSGITANGIARKGVGGGSS
jgi:hypothetical protein